MTWRKVWAVGTFGTIREGKLRSTFLRHVGKPGRYLGMDDADGRTFVMRAEDVFRKRTDAECVAALRVLAHVGED